MIKEFKTIIALRRDTDLNYIKRINWIPKNGEVLFVDTISSGLMMKVGDGVKTYPALPFFTLNNQELLIQGFYYEDNFYLDEDHTQKCEGSVEKLYLDKKASLLYYFNGSKFIQLTSQEIGTATEERMGIMKLYGGKGQNTDGTMTQKAITDNLNTKVSASVKEVEEMLILNNNDLLK